MEFFLLWCVFALVIAFWADTRGQSMLGFFFCSAFLSPIFACLILLLMDNKVEKEEERKRQEELDQRKHEMRMEELRALVSNSKGVA